MHDSIESTSIFMKSAGQEVKQAPGIPSQEILRLRLSLELEELEEKADAFGLKGTFQEMLYKLLDKNACIALKFDDEYSSLPEYYIAFEPDGDSGVFNMAEVLDACADQAVVSAGTILACGLQDYFDAAMDNVSKSNMSKFPMDYEELMATVDKYEAEGIEVDILIPNGDDDEAGAFPCTVLRASDGKVLKNINYIPANMQAILGI